MKMRAGTTETSEYEVIVTECAKFMFWMHLENQKLYKINENLSIKKRAQVLVISKRNYLCISRNRKTTSVVSEEIAQLVEHNLAKVRVASSSSFSAQIKRVQRKAESQCPGGNGRDAHVFRCVCREACRFESVGHCTSGFNGRNWRQIGGGDNLCRVSSKSFPSRRMWE